MPFRLRLTHWILVSMGLAVVAAGAYLMWHLYRPLPIAGASYSFDVRTGATLRSVARDLETAGVLHDERLLVFIARWNKVDRSIKAGNYELPAGTNLLRLLARLTQGDANQTAFKIVEGTTFAELKATLAADPRIARTALDLPERELAELLGIGASRVEGWFFPDTYFFTTGTTDLALMKRAHVLMRQRLEAAWERRAADLPVATPYEALILASIVEKETGRAEDRPLVASVLMNRLRLGMRLQVDPTVIYGLGSTFDGDLRRRDLERDTPYNTYTRDGLPPTPIALPGQASIDAVLNPPRTEYLYFVARGDGTSEFSKNLADHGRAVARFQKGGQ